MTKDEALKLALEALENAEYGDYDKEELNQAITAIKEALAQPEQEPFAYINVEKRRLEFAHDYVKWDTPTTIKLDKIPLYTTPPQRTWVGLIRKEFAEILCDDRWRNRPELMMLQVQAKLKEKNT